MTHVIDAWAQHPTPRHLNHPMFESLRRWTRGLGGAELAGEGPWPVQVTLDAMDAGGISCSLLSAWVGPQGALISNDEVAGFVSQAPDRLVGVGSVDISRPRDAVRELRRCVRELGFKAVRVLPWLWELPPTHARFYPVYAECCELGIPFCTQVGHTGPLLPSEFGRPIPYVDQIAIDFHGLPHLDADASPEQVQSFVTGFFEALEVASAQTIVPVDQAMNAQDDADQQSTEPGATAPQPDENRIVSRKRSTKSTFRTRP